MTLGHAAEHLLRPKKRVQDQPGIWLYFEQRRNQRKAILLPLYFRPAAGGGVRSVSREIAAARGGDRLASVRQTTEAQ